MLVAIIVCRIFMRRFTECRYALCHDALDNTSFLKKLAHFVNEKQIYLTPELGCFSTGQYLTLAYLLTNYSSWF